MAYSQGNMPVLKHKYSITVLFKGGYGIPSSSGDGSRSMYQGNTAGKYTQPLL